MANENVNVTMLKTEVTNITINPDLLLWEDMLEMTEVQEKVEKGEMSQRDQLAFLSGLLSKMTGLDMSKQPARVVTSLIEELGNIAGNQERKN
jgi:hypothetical protein